MNSDTSPTISAPSSSFGRIEEVDESSTDSEENRGSEQEDMNPLDRLMAEEFDGQDNE